MERKSPRSKSIRSAPRGIGQHGDLTAGEAFEKGKLDALNQSGAFLHIAAIRAATKSGCQYQTELPVRVAPFVSDPMSQEGIASRRGGPTGPLLLNRTRLQVAIAKSQDGQQGRQRTVDLTAIKSSGRNRYMFTMEVKRRDPQFVDWVFINQNMESKNYFAAAVSTTENSDALSLMELPRYKREGSNLYVRKELLTAIDSIVDNHADYGLVITYAGKQKAGDPMYKFQDTSLHDAVGQVLEGAYGMIVDMVTHQASNATLEANSTVYYIPIIVTNANLLICRYSLDDLTNDLSGMQKVELEPCSSLVYYCPHPVMTRFPRQITDVNRYTQAIMATKWPVIVTNIGDLKRILDGL